MSFKRIFYVFCTVCFFSFSVKGQNQLQNADFEAGNVYGVYELKTQFSTTGGCPFWVKPDEHKYSFTATYSDFPKNMNGVNASGVQAYQGSAFLQMLYDINSGSFGSTLTERSYGITKLILLNNYRYSYSYWLNVTEVGKVDISKLGIRFSETLPEITKITKGSELRATGNTQTEYLDAYQQSAIRSSEWIQVTGQFVAGRVFSYLTVGYFGNPNGEVYVNVDDFSIENLGLDEEICDPTELVQDYSYTHSKVHEAQNSLRSGFNVGAGGSTGNVIVNPNNKVLNKAGGQVSLEPGFETEYGADFLAYIAPCDVSPCDDIPPTDLEEITFELCGGGSNKINSGFTFGPGGHFSWSPSTHLSSSNSPNPEFRAPIGSGTITYTVTYSNFCGVSASQQVIVNYSNQTSTPIFSVSNQIADEYAFEMDCQASSSNSEWMEISVINSTTNSVVYTTGQLHEGVDYTNGFYAFQAPLYTLTSVCNDYIVEVKTKEICNDNEATVQYEWNRSSYCNPKPQLISTPTNFSPDGDGVEDEYCIEVCGADEYFVEVRNSGGTIVYTNSVNILSSNLCIWNGGSSPSGTYEVDITLFSCGTGIAQTPFTITLAR